MIFENQKTAWGTRLYMASADKELSLQLFPGKTPILRNPKRAFLRRHFTFYKSLINL